MERRPLPQGARFARMATIQRDSQAEQGAVFDWRLEALQRAGYPLTEAWLIAAAPQVDLRDAERLLASGCPPETAARILI